MQLKFLMILLFVFMANPVFATEGRVELVERLGEKIPLQLDFIDSTGAVVTLDQLVDRPTLIVPVFYDCRNVCNMLLGRLSAVLPEIKMKPGEDYNVVTFSFDPLETSAMAAHSKQTFLTAMQVPYPRQAWRFVTGTQENILQLTDAAGYFFKKEGDEFLHPITAFVVTEDGTIVRYLPGQRFSAIDLSMALFEASEGRIGKPIRQALQFCFSYDPEGRRYVFNLMRVSGTVILLTLGSFLLFLILSGRKKKK
ncbi:SCO family protein [uncultured Desulfuromusa sp.]|uniref:SCO family protein n=1 Tax=uncultured Desulfuromusa sp. TaxID=219183 RepID=UPI002AA95ABC|nr:SCO family protein [uncultured Desulfuromusa sp.]